MEKDYAELEESMRILKIEFAFLDYRLGLMEDAAHKPVKKSFWGWLMKGG